MLYQGGKKRIGKRIAKVILAIEDELGYENLPYLEPFCGMCSVIRHIPKTRKLHCSDINKDVVLLLNSVKNNTWNPVRKCSKQCWERYRKSRKHSSQRAFVGIAGSWGGVFFNGFRLKPGGKDYLREANNELEKLQPSLKKIRISHKSYTSYEPKGYLIYCDPPYKGNKLKDDNGVFQGFDHERFWKTMRKWSKKNIVIISESSAPSDFKKIWTVKSHVTNSKKTKRYTDNLYVYKNTKKKLSSSFLRKLKKI